jgi:hypothetical protein
MKITHILVWNALTKNQKPYIGVEILLKPEIIKTINTYNRYVFRWLTFVGPDLLVHDYVFNLQCALYLCYVITLVKLHIVNTN